MTILSTILYKFTFLSDRLKIEGANVINMDIPATNGVIQVNHENMWGCWLINWSSGRWWFPCQPTMFFLCRLWKVSSSSLALYSPSREKQFDISIRFVRRSQSIWHSAFCCRSRLTLHDHQTVKNAFMSILFVLYYKPLWNLYCCCDLTSDIQKYMELSAKIWVSETSNENARTSHFFDVGIVG